LKGDKKIKRRKNGILCGAISEGSEKKIGWTG
jgi:hypothetical protein